jgi:hypothetical protein
MAGPACQDVSLISNTDPAAGLMVPLRQAPSRLTSPTPANNPIIRKVVTLAGLCNDPCRLEPAP